MAEPSISHVQYWVQIQHQHLHQTFHTLHLNLIVWPVPARYLMNYVNQLYRLAIT